MWGADKNSQRVESRFPLAGSLSLNHMILHESQQGRWEKQHNTDLREEYGRRRCTLSHFHLQTMCASRCARLNVCRTRNDSNACRHSIKRGRVCLDKRKGSETDCNAGHGKAGAEGVFHATPAESPVHAVAAPWARSCARLRFSFTFCRISA